MLTHRRPLPAAAVGARRGVLLYVVMVTTERGARLSTILLILSLQLAWENIVVLPYFQATMKKEFFTGTCRLRGFLEKELTNPILTLTLYLIYLQYFLGEL